VLVLLLEEQLGIDGVHHHLDTSHVQDAVVQELVQLRHLVEQKQLVLVHRIASQYQLPLLHPALM
jgi:hypothetical protein